MDQEKIQIKWSAHEYEEKSKSTDWFWALGLLALAGAIVAIIYKNYLFAIFIILGSATAVMYSVRKPDIIEFEVSEKGVKIKDIFYPYKNLKSFWVQIGKEDRLLLESGRAFVPLMVLPMTNDVTGAVRETLVKYLPEKEMIEPAAHRVFESLGF